MKFKKIFKQFLLASVIAFFLSLINLNLYNSNPNLTPNSPISQIPKIVHISFAPSFGIEKSYAGWLTDWIEDVVDAVVNIIEAVADRVQNIFAAAVGLHNALIGGVSNLFEGESFARGWNCNYYDTTGRLGTEPNSFFGGETCKNSESEEVVRVCKSDTTKITPDTAQGRVACPPAKHFCRFGLSEVEKSSRAKMIAKKLKEINDIKTKLKNINYGNQFGLHAGASNTGEVISQAQIDLLDKQLRTATQDLRLLYKKQKRTSIDYYPDRTYLDELSSGVTHEPKSVADADLSCNHVPTTSVK